MLAVPTSVIKNVHAELFNFLWKNNKRQNKKFGYVSEGGLNFVNFLQ